MNRKEQALTKPILLIGSLIIVVALCCVFYQTVLVGIGHVSVFSAKMILPTDSYYVSNEVEKTQAVNQTTQATTEEKQTQTTTKKLEDTSEKVQTVYKTINSIEEFTQTPDDVLAWIETAKKSADKDKKDGKIYELQYTDEGVTDKFGNVKVKNVNATQIDIESLLKQKAELSIDKDKPCILIYHSHTTEAFQTLDRDFYATGFLSRNEDLEKNMARVGNEICSELEKAGYKVIHDTKIHDFTYSNSYPSSKESIIDYLKKYPSIEVAIDVHRDAIQTDDGTKYKPTAEINGKKAAQIMIISGCQESGNGIEDFEDWKYNLRFALDFQQNLETLFEGITRPLYFCPRKYNMNLTRNSVLVEVGSDANTLQEALYTGKCIGVALSCMLDDYVLQKED